MKILLTGSNGQLGREIARQAQFLDYKLMETDLHNLDITNAGEVLRVVSDFRPDIIINSAAFTNVDLCEKDEETAFRVNALGAGNLSAAAYNSGAAVVQISTDYVFDGTLRRSLREYDQVNPRSVYGKSKEFGERLVRQANPRHFILRTAWLYGEGNNFVRTMLKLSQEKESISVVNDQTGTPTSTKDLASVVLKLAETANYGTYHATCEGQCTWYEFAKKIFEIKGIKINVEPITTEQLNRPAERPEYSVLDNFMLRMIGQNTFRDWETALIEYLEGEN